MSSPGSCVTARCGFQAALMREGAAAGVGERAVLAAAVVADRVDSQHLASG